jgi:hypothetical protein
MKLFNKEIKTEIKQQVFFVEGKIDIDADYFIKKIEEGIINSENNFLTNIHGFMTSWDYFIKDEKFLKIFLKLINNLEYHSSISSICDTLPDWTLKSCWGIKETEGGFTKKHDHRNSVLSGVIYLNDVKQELIFEEINIRLSAEKGKFAIFSPSENKMVEIG